MTASLGQPGDHGWFVGALADLHAMGWGELDVLDLNGLPRDRGGRRLDGAGGWSGRDAGGRVSPRPYL